MLFAFARDGLLPRALGLIYPRTQTPYVAILAYAALAMVLALTGTFAELAVLATLTTAALYAVGCVAAWLLARRKVAVAGVPLNFRWLGVAALVGVIGMLALIALGSWQEIAGLATLIGISVFVYLVTSRPQAARARSAKAGE
jgi:amino acid transporter